MNDFATHAAALAMLQDRLGADCPVFTWSDKDWPMIPNTAVLRRDLSPGGMPLLADLRFEVLTSTLITDTLQDANDVKEAMLNTPLGYQGDVYKVVSVGIRPGGLQLVVEANSIAQNASR